MLPGERLGSRCHHRPVINVVARKSVILNVTELNFSAVFGALPWLDGGEPSKGLRAAQRSGPA